MLEWTIFGELKQNNFSVFSRNFFSSFLILVLFIFFFYRFPGILCNYLMPYLNKVNGNVWARGLSKNRKQLREKADSEMRTHTTKRQWRSWKSMWLQEEGELSSSLATNYWTNYLPVKILLTQLQGWENTWGGGSEPEASEFLHWHEGSCLRIVGSSPLAQSRVSWKQVNTWNHCSLSGQPVPVFDYPLNNLFSCGISCVSVWPLVLLWGPLGRPWLPLPPAHKVFLYTDEILQSLP